MADLAGRFPIDDVEHARLVAAVCARLAVAGVTVHPMGATSAELTVDLPGFAPGHAHVVVLAAPVVKRPASDTGKSGGGGSSRPSGHA